MKNVFFLKKKTLLKHNKRMFSFFFPKGHKGWGHTGIRNNTRVLLSDLVDRLCSIVSGACPARLSDEDLFSSCVFCGQPLCLSLYCPHPQSHT